MPAAVIAMAAAMVARPAITIPKAAELRVVKACENNTAPIALPARFRRPLSRRVADILLFRQPFRDLWQRQRHGSPDIRACTASFYSLHYRNKDTDQQHGG